MHGIGVDILHLPRLARLLAKPYAERLPRRILTPRELERYRDLPEKKQLQFLASRWTLKEAAWKASQPIQSSWKDAEISYTDYGQPLIMAAHLGIDFKCSLSHDGDYCIAYVLATMKTDKRGTGEMISDYTRDVPRQKDHAPEWLEKW